MSWLSENYDKAALGVAAVAVIAVGLSILSSGEDIAEPTTVTPNNTVEIPQSSDLAKVIEKFSAERAFEAKTSNGNEVQSFVAYPLYSVKGQDKPSSLTDEFEIHPGMPLGWWKKYDLEDYRQDDGPDLDADKDGFTNREEFIGKTDPTDEASRPDLIAKLKCLAVKGTPYEISWTKLSAEEGNFTFRYNNRRIFYGSLKVGGKFPVKAKGKYEFLNERFEIVKKDQDPEIAGEEGEYYVIQDNGQNQNKKTFKLYYRAKPKLVDLTGTFILNIDGSKTPFSVPEGGTFSLPYDEKAKNKPYQFKSKKGEKAEIEYGADSKKMTAELDIKAAK